MKPMLLWDIMILFGFFFIIEIPIVYSLLDSLMWSIDRLVWLLGNGKTMTKRNLGRKEII